VKTTVLERGRLGREASWAAAGLIGPQAEAEQPGPFFDLCVQGKDAFDSIVERLTRESGVDPEYDDHGVLWVAFDGEQRSELERRARWQLKAGGRAEELTPAQALKLAPALSSKITFALHLPTNRRAENRKLVLAYVNAAVRAGATFQEGIRVEAIVASNGRASGVRTADGSMHEADVVVNAAGAWAGELRGLEADAIHFRPVRPDHLFRDAPRLDRSLTVLCRRDTRPTARRACACRFGVRGGGLQQERDA
jgi:glycine oxidase